MEEIGGEWIGQEGNGWDWRGLEGNGWNWRGLEGNAVVVVSWTAVASVQPGFE